MEVNISSDKFYKKMVLNSLKALILFIALFINKNVCEFRINQEMILKLFIVTILGLWAIKFFTSEENHWHKNRLNLSILFFTLMITISLLRNNKIIEGSKEYIIYLSYFIIYFLIINNVDNKKQFDKFFKLFFLTSFIISMYTLLQYYGIIAYLKDYGPVISTIGQKNWTSNYLALIFPLMFSYFLLEKSKRRKIFYFVILSIMYATLMICQSRGIWISISITLMAAIYIIFKSKLLKIFRENRKWLILLVFTFLIITIIYSTDNPLNKSAITVPQRALSTFDEKDPSINTRFLIWGTTIDMIKDKPLFGSGIGTFKMNYLRYQAEFLENNEGYLKYWTNAWEAHNEYLQMWAELGIIGLGIFFSIIFGFYNLVWKFLKEEKDSKKKLISWGLFLGIICFLFHSLFTFPLHVPALGSAFFTLLGLTVAYISGLNLSKVSKNNKVLKKAILKNLKVKIIFSALILILMILVIDLLVIKPYLAEIYYFKGMKQIVNKDYTEAVSNFDYATKLDPYNGRILHALGTTYYDLKIFYKAEEILQKTKEYIIDVNTFYKLGLVYFQMKKYKKAEEEFKQAIYLNPKFTKAYYDLGYLYFTQEKYDDTIQQWNKILEIEPNFPNNYIVLNNLGIVYKKKQMPDKALEYFLEALPLVPEGSPLIEEIEKEIYNIYKSKLEK